MGTEEPQTNLVVRREETPFPIARLVPGSKLAGRAGICQAIVAELASATGPVEQVLVTGVAVRAVGIEPAEAERIGWEAGMSRAAVAGIAMPSGEVPGAPVVITDQALAPAVAAVPPAWDRGEVAAVGAVVEAGDAVGKWTGSHE